jgi:hypothetical protein
VQKLQQFSDGGAEYDRCQVWRGSGGNCIWMSRKIRYSTYYKAVVLELKDSKYGNMKLDQIRKSI